MSIKYNTYFISTLKHKLCFFELTERNSTNDGLKNSLKPFIAFNVNLLDAHFFFFFVFSTRNSNY